MLHSEKETTTKNKQYKLEGSHCATQKHTKYIKYSCTEFQNFHFNHTLKNLGNSPNSHFSIQLESVKKILQISTEVFNPIILHYGMKTCAIKRLGQITDIAIVL